MAARVIMVEDEGYEVDEAAQAEIALTRLRSRIPLTARPCRVSVESPRVSHVAVPWACAPE